MRLKTEIQAYIQQKAAEMFPNSSVYLFGSRVNDDEKGGDIDLLFLSDKKIENRQFQKFRIEFYKKFGWQKIDLVTFTHNDDSAFKNMILQNAQRLW